MIAQIGGFDKLHIRMIRRHQLGVLADATDQHAGEQEIGNDEDAAVAEPDRLTQPRFHQREGDPGIDRFAPAEAETLHQHAGHLGHIGVGVRVGGAPTDNHQQGVVQRRRHFAGEPGPGIGSLQG